MAENNKLNDPSRPPVGNQQTGPERLQTDLQVDPQLAEGPASGSRIVAFAAAIVVILGAVFYGLNNTATSPDTSKTTATQTTPAASPATPPNAAPGTTTSTAPANPQQPKSGPTGTEVDRSKGGGPTAK